jgi:putative flippase GtrA
LLGLAAFLKFGSLSGLGWLLDFAILILLVGFLGAPTFAANLISSSVAAMSVFLISRNLIFTPARGALAARLAIYFAYTLVMICIAASAMTLIVDALSALGSQRDWHASAAVQTGIAKILVTPPMLVLNFLASRYASERKMQARA